MRIFDCDRLFLVSRRACKRSRQTPDDALVAILFAAAALEAFINELAEWVKLDEQASDSERLLAWTLDIMEEGRRPTESKLKRAVEVLSGAPADFSRPPYQDVRLLFAIRDRLVHGKHEEMKWDDNFQDLVSEQQRKLVRVLEQRRIVPPVPKTSLPPPWMDCVSYPSAADWAFETSLISAEHLTALLPDGWIKRNVANTLQRLRTLS